MEIGTNTLTNKNTFSSIAKSAEVNDTSIMIMLEDGRKISIPLYYFNELENAPKSKREKVEVFYGVRGLVWKSLDIHLSVPRLLGFDED